jgi:cytochrome c553
MTAETVVPPMGGLAVMAWKLACYRAYGEDGYLPIAFLKSRAHVLGQIRVECANDWYWDIVAYVESGHQWQAEKEFASCSRCHNTKAMRDFKRGEYHRGY